MSTAAASQTCGCGCGQAVIGRRYLNARHKERSGPPKPKSYPHYISAELREVLCGRHGHVFTQHLKHWQGVTADWMTLRGCPECESEEKARLERLKPKPSTNPCENRTCSCPAPKCPDCGRLMTMGPGCLGSHSWVCNDYAQVEDSQAPPGGIIPKPFVLTGSHKREQWTGWRNNLSV